MEEEPTESLWVKIKGRAGTGDITVGVCYRPPDRDERVDEALYRHIGAASRSKALVLMGTSATPTSVGGTTQQGTGNPGGSWNVLRTTSSSK